jgi:hypothetical protein
MGIYPRQILDRLQKAALADSGVVQGLEKQEICHPAMLLTSKAIKNLRKRMLAETRVDKNDAIAVDKICNTLGDSVVLYYKPQVVEEGEIKEHLRIAICTEVQRAMLRSFGSKLIFMDTVFGLSLYGYPTLTLLVRDEYGHGFPVAYCISSAENKEIWVEFLQAVLNAAGLSAENLNFMIDKSQTEISAIKAIGAKYLLCKFHMLQDWERFLKSTQSGMHGRTNQRWRQTTLWELSALQLLTDRGVFEANSAAFEDSLQNSGFGAVLRHYQSNWKDIAEHWARLGRTDVASLNSDTNNLIEAHFRGVKYNAAGRKVCQRLDDQLILLLNTIASFILRRQQRLCAATRTSAEDADEQLNHWVQQLSDPQNGHINFFCETSGSDDDIGAANCQSCSTMGQSYDLCLADGSCNCRANADDVCKHVEAACLYPGRGCSAQIIRTAANKYLDSMNRGNGTVQGDGDV